MRTELATHPAVPADRLVRLLAEGETAAVANPSLPVAALTQLVELVERGGERLGVDDREA